MRPSSMRLGARLVRSTRRTSFTSKWKANDDDRLTAAKTPNENEPAIEPGKRVEQTPKTR